MINLRFTPELFAIIRANAAAEGIGVGLYLVRLIEKMLIPKTGRENECSIKN
ncbi:hypothetical protein ACRAOD_22950 [Raoultella ornithinolytica]|uniref:hypothetical protein n=1 Tax=Enterobacteriaceae TaxID=543 RepID=UPI001F06B7CC|nr:MULTISPECIES: hypothetical protein [Enterobacteriaceae]MDU1517979.1 hypothetical protein [Klebsiella michiganensis]UMJ17551.1 hypothetical protein JJ445_22310 [Klebsiella pneumoniae]HDZ9754532.1 hypothetical protein [Klebsiella quasipneumoniae subsp. similipneumoniae]MCT8172394.1 hypothetical protein [Raoultella ornithinolytica]MDC7949379.1 hypothetical protein [Enterobacter kobei]